MHFQWLQAHVIAALLLGAAGTASAQKQSVVNPAVACGKTEKRGCTYRWNSDSNTCLEQCTKKDTGVGGFDHSEQAPIPREKTSRKSSSGTGSGTSAAGESPQ